MFVNSFIRNVISAAYSQNAEKLYDFLQKGCHLDTLDNKKFSAVMYLVLQNERSAYLFLEAYGASPIHILYAAIYSSNMPLIKEYLSKISLTEEIKQNIKMYASMQARLSPETRDYFVDALSLEHENYGYTASGAIISSNLSSLYDIIERDLFKSVDDIVEAASGASYCGKASFNFFLINYKKCLHDQHYLKLALNAAKGGHLVLARRILERTNKLFVEQNIFSLAKEAAASGHLHEVLNFMESLPIYLRDYNALACHAAMAGHIGVTIQLLEELPLANRNYREVINSADRANHPSLIHYLMQHRTKKIQLSSMRKNKEQEEAEKQASVILASLKRGL